MKRIAFLAVAATVAVGAAASVQTSLQGTEFRVDTIAHYYIGPGVTHTQLAYRAMSGGRQFRAYVIDYDRTAPGAELIQPKVELGRDSCQTAETLTSMARRKTTEDAQYIAGINGDFFITSSFSAQHEFGNRILGYPNMACVVNSTIAAPDMIDITSRENAIIFGNDGGMWIDATDFRYRVLNNDGSIKIDATAVNYPRRANEMVVYNSYNGNYTKTDNTGRELVLQMASGQSWHINASTKFKVVGEWRQGGNSRIPENGLVISVGPDWTNKNKAFLDELKDGDVVKLKIVCSLPAFDALKPDIREICGGDVRILKENVTTTEAIRWINTPSALYSRSLVGYSQDRNHLVFCAVDAGASNSTGVSYYEAADLMRNLGCWDALDLDGGGSTALWTSAKGFMNHLRDGSERAIGNGLFMRLNAPADSRVVTIRFADHVARLPKYGLYTPVIYGYNQYGQLVDMDVKGFTLIAPEELGSVTEDQTGLLASGSGTHALTARLGDTEATIAVTVDTSFPAEPRVKEVVMDQFTGWTVEMQAQVGDDVLPVSAKAFEWTSDDPSVATVTSDGYVVGVSTGTTVVRGTAGDVNAAVTVSSEIMPTHTYSIPATEFFTDQNFNAEGWKTGGTGVKNHYVSADGKGFKINFNISSTRGTRVTASKDIRLFGRPDHFRMVFNGAVAPTSAVVTFAPANGRTVTYTAEGFKAGADNVLEFDASELKDANVSDVAFYPLTFKSVGFNYSSSLGTYSLSVPTLEAVHTRLQSGIEDISVDGPATEGGTLDVLVQGRTILLGGSVAEVAVYDVQGREVCRATDTDCITVPATGLLLVRADGASAKVVVY